jgi:hypothetical protein
MSNRINSSLCLTDLGDKYRAGHSAFSKGNNSKIYVNITSWINDEPDKFGNDVSHQLNSKQDQREAEGKVYVGNGKTATLQQAAAPASQPASNPASQLPGSGLPF